MAADASESAAPVATAAPMAAATAAPPAPSVTETPVQTASATADTTAEADGGPLAPKFSALAKREKELTLREKREKDALAAREAALLAREKGLDEKIASAGSLDDLLKLARERPTEFFAKTGLTYAGLTEAVLKEGEAPTADDRVSKLEARLEAEAKKREADAEKGRADAVEREKRESEAIVTNFVASIGEFVKANAETYELVAAEGAHDLVFDVIEAHYKKTGQVLPTDRAAELVESHLLDEAARKFRGSKKIAALFAAAGLPPPAILKPLSGAAAASAAAAAAKRAPTLTNATGVAGAPPSGAKQPLLSAREIAEKYRRDRRARNARA